MTKPSSRSSVARARFCAAPLALMLLAAFGLFVSGCGDDSPTTPTPTPTPTPPTPEPPAVPTGLQVASTGPDYIEWSWTAVEGATGYDIQMSLTEGDFSNSQLAEVEAGTTSRRFTVAAETTAYARVRAKNADGESDWSATVSGTSMAAPIVLAAPANLRVTETEARSITWAWNVVAGASGYVVEMSLGDAMFTPADRTLNPAATAAPQATFEVDPETVAFVRVRGVAGSGADRVEGPWGLAVRGESEQLPLTAPSGLEVSGRGTNYIEWSWDAVEGATSYDAQISLEDDNFSPPSSTFNGLTQRTHRVPNLDPNDVVYLRVRAAVGTRQSVWSAAVRGQTEPPPVVALTTPAGLTATGPGRNSVNLEWNDVTDADHYEVEQRVGGGAWGDATCRATGDNEPSTSACVATELEAGTEYAFRVRAIPADDATLQKESAWSSMATATTTGRQSVGGGAGALNVTWRSTETTIIWRWDQAGLADFEYKVLTSVQDRDTPCDTRGGTTGTQLGNSFEQRSLTSSTTRVLCVRSITTDNAGKVTRGEWSYGWAVTSPDGPGVPDDGPQVRFEDDVVGVNEEGGLTTVLRWKVDYSNQPEFDYEFRFYADESDKTTDNWPAADPTGDDAQRRCNAMTVSDTVTPGGHSAPVVFESRIDLVPYADYRMCYRAVNDDGFSDWAIPLGDAGRRWTRPLKPSISGDTVRINTDQTGNAQGTSHFRLSWQVTTSQDGPLPGPTDAGTTDATIRGAYNFKVLRTIGTSPQTAADADDVLKACDGRASINPPANLEAVAAITDPEIQEGISGLRRFDLWKILGEDTQTRYYYLCVQALDARGGTRGGGRSQWAASSGYRHASRAR